MKKLSYLFILLLFPIVAFAQEATVQDKENKEKIKEIKLSEDYVYCLLYTSPSPRDTR